MEEVMKLESTCGSNRVHHHQHQPSLSMHKDSHVISKFKPKIRIVHIYAPEIIKTDVANFRDLVQKLTGKPSSDRKISSKNKQKARATSSSEASRGSDHHNNNFYKQQQQQQQQQQPKMTTESSSDGFQSSDYTSTYGDRIKEEDEEVIWGGEKYLTTTTSSIAANNFFNGSGFNDFEGLIQGLGDFPILPFNSSQMAEMFHHEENYLT